AFLSVKKAGFLKGFEAFGMVFAVENLNELDCGLLAFDFDEIQDAIRGQWLTRLLDVIQGKPRSHDACAIGLSEAFEAGGEIDVVADDGVLEDSVGTHVSDAHGTGVDSNPNA